MYVLTVETGLFKTLSESLTTITQDRRLQLLLIAFCFGSFFEGAAGFGTSVAVTAAILIGLGFKPLQASGLALTQLAVSNLHGPWLVDIAASVVSMACLIAFLLVWKPGNIYSMAHDAADRVGAVRVAKPAGAVIKAWMPWVILSVLVGLWGTPVIKNGLDKISLFKFPVHGLHLLVQRMPPVVVKPTPEPAVFMLNWLSMTGTGIFIASILSGIVAGLSLGRMIKLYGRTLVKVRFSLLTISAMMAIGFLTRFSGLDATMGLAFARTGALYPFFGTMLGWLGVALTGSDTSSNVLFGSLQKITAQQVGVQPALMASANSVGGVMGKMIDAQSIVVASTATQWYGHEGDILRYVFFHSIALAALGGCAVFLMAYVSPFVNLVMK
jgi:lactate permease